MKENLVRSRQNSTLLCKIEKSYLQGTSSSGYYFTEVMMREQIAREEERDGLFYAMDGKQQEIMDYRRTFQAQTASSFTQVQENQAHVAHSLRQLQDCNASLAAQNSAASTLRTSPPQQESSLTTIFI
ncbi:unnamed protein product [Vicia faba]|uniref:Uncharacterized protein n=1 Tax=Vicia faba TaxID=3906 RepID=A0AAV0ZB72_VICFA|nr:unnamed protein product [Vicia faba]